jgi:AraC-like DNA-binding protein
MQTPERSGTYLISPSKALGSCVRAFIVRSTVEAPLADAADRLNRYPGTPLCSIGWCLHGTVEMVEPPPPDPLPPFEPVIFVGPQTQHTITYNPGPVHSFVIMFYPHAMHALTGVDVPHWVDRWSPVDKALGPEWVALADAVFRAPDDEARVALCEVFLEPRWLAVRPASAGGRASEWVRRLVTQAEAMAMGSQSVRNIERRIKAWAGQPMRTLRRLQRAEQAFFESRADKESGHLSLSDVAARNGYADQAHMSREAREITGHSPSEMTRQIKGNDESYWIYRIWK